MNIKPMIKAIAALAVSAMMFSASANSVGFDSMYYPPSGGTITVTVNYDFTDFAMFGGGVDIIYDTGSLEFVSYTQAELSADAQAPASPEGMLTEAGMYTGAGIGTFEFFNGMTSAGDIGSFAFNVIGVSTGSTPCGSALCLQVNAINPFVSLAGADVSANLIDNGISSAGGSIIPFPVPAAVWFMLSGLGVLIGFSRKPA